MRTFFTSALTVIGCCGVSVAFGQNLLAGYPASSASVTYVRPTDRATAALPVASAESADESIVEATATPLATKAQPVAFHRTLTIVGAWPASAGPLTVEVLDMMGRPVVRQVRAVAATEEDQLTLPVPTLPANTYIVRVLDARGTQLHRETVAYAPRR